MDMAGNAKCTAEKRHKKIPLPVKTGGIAASNLGRIRSSLGDTDKYV
jgi:hypothetical protein